MEKDLLKMDLQFFAEDDTAGTSDQSEGAEESSQHDNQDEEKTFTQEELDSIVEARLKRERADLQKQIEEIKEEQRLSQLSEKERKQAEEAKRLADLEEREKAIKYKEDLAETRSILVEEGMPIEFAEFLIAEKAEDTMANINHFKDTFNEAVKAQAKKYLEGKEPKVGAGYSPKPSNGQSKREIFESANIIKNPK